MKRKMGTTASGMMCVCLWVAGIHEMLVVPTIHGRGWCGRGTFERKSPQIFTISERQSRDRLGGTTFLTVVTFEPDSVQLPTGTGGVF